MEIVIEIDDKLYERISYLEPRSSTILDRLLRAVQKGTPLPKNHGRLIEADKVVSQLANAIPYMIFDSKDEAYVEGLQRAKIEIDDAPTIIGAEVDDDDE